MIDKLAAHPSARDNLNGVRSLAQGLASLRCLFVKKQITVLEEKQLRIHLGVFESHSGQLVVSDPCYELGNWGQGVLENVTTGKWNAYVEKIDGGEWGERCAVVIALHESLREEDEAAWEACDFVVAVDSGQAGIFERTVYRNDDSVVGETTFDPDDKWYSSCCDLTLTDLGAGVINGGVVSSSGFGDGGYVAFVARNSEGKVVGVQIVFITDEDLEEEEEV